MLTASETQAGITITVPGTYNGSTITSTTEVEGNKTITKVTIEIDCWGSNGVCYTITGDGAITHGKQVHVISNPNPAKPNLPQVNQFGQFHSMDRLNNIHNIQIHK